MNRAFQKISFLFFLGFGAFYLSADFLLNQVELSSSKTLRSIYQVFDMPFFFSAGMYTLSSIKLWLEKTLPLPFLSAFFILLAIAFTFLLLYVNLDFKSFF